MMEISSMESDLFSRCWVCWFHEGTGFWDCNTIFDCDDIITMLCYYYGYLTGW